MTAEVDIPSMRVKINVADKGGLKSAVSRQTNEIAFYALVLTVVEGGFRAFCPDMESGDFIGDLQELLETGEASHVCNEGDLHILQGFLAAMMHAAGGDKQKVSDALDRIDDPLKGSGVGYRLTLEGREPITYALPTDVFKACEHAGLKDQLHAIEQVVMGSLRAFWVDGLESEVFTADDTVEWALGPVTVTLCVPPEVRARHLSLVP